MPGQLPHLEALVLRSIPDDYAKATRSRWRPEVPNGTYLGVTAARKPDWIEENRTNPLRDWDGREHISSARYKKSVSQFGATKRAVIAILQEGSDGTTLSRLAELGDEFARSFNKISGRSEFIETEEREELLLAMAAVFDDLQRSALRSLETEREAFLVAVDNARDW